jgi:hypothetical protein
VNESNPSGSRFRPITLLTAALAFGAGALVYRHYVPIPGQGAASSRDARIPGASVLAPVTNRTPPMVLVASAPPGSAAENSTTAVPTKAPAGSGLALLPVTTADIPAAPAAPAEARPAARVVVTTVQAAAAKPGFLEGVVRLDGTPPARREITPIRADRLCGALHAEPVLTRTYLVGADRGLANVVVSLVALPAGIPFTAPTESPLLDQVGCIYEPMVTSLMTNQPVRIRNSDPFMHNVNAQARVNRGFNFAQATQGQVNEKAFPEPESPLKLICNVHPWMSAYLHVFPHPFHAVTDADGRWHFAQPLPPGRYELRFLHTAAGSTNLVVEITAATTPRLESSLPVPAT